MSDNKLRFNINTEELSSSFGELKSQVKKDLDSAASALATATERHIKEQAKLKLSSSLANRYRKALSVERPEANVHIISLNEDALWIEDGHDAWTMYDKLGTSSKAKISKDGHKYMTIPFDHSKAPTENSPAAQEIVNQLKKELKSRGINYRKLELNSDGSPKIGKLHTFNFDSARPTDKAKFPSLHGVTVYQNKTPGGGVKKSIMTFRVISEKTKGDGRWEYKARKGANLFEDGFTWAQKTWETQLLPEILKEYE